MKHKIILRRTEKKTLSVWKKNENLPHSLYSIEFQEDVYKGTTCQQYTCLYFS